MKCKLIVLAFAIVTAPIAQAVTISFQEGDNGYTGTQDTFLFEFGANDNHGSDITLSAGYGGMQILLGFEDLFGNGANQVPTEHVQIMSASLIIEVTDDDTLTYGVHRMLANWDENSSWNTLVGGVQADGSEALAIPDDTFVPLTQGSYTLDVTSSVNAWKNGAANLGWMIEYNTFSWPEGIALASSEFPVANMVPILSVEYIHNPEASTALPLLAVLGALSFIRRRRR